VNPGKAFGCRQFGPFGDLSFARKPGFRQDLQVLQAKGESMKASIAGLILAAVWTIAPIQADNLSPAAKMSGADPVYGSTRGCVAGSCEIKKMSGGTNKTCRYYATGCRNNSGSPACETSYSNCLSTGIFVGPRGANFSGLIRQ
jgi:hypothetical protein